MLAPALQLRHLQHKSIKCRQKRTEGKVILVGSIISIINIASLINTRKSQNKNGHYAIVLNVKSNKLILKTCFYSMLLFNNKNQVPNSFNTHKVGMASKAAFWCCHQLGGFKKCVTQGFVSWCASSCTRGLTSQ